HCADIPVYVDTKRVDLRRRLHFLREGGPRIRGEGHHGPRDRRREPRRLPPRLGLSASTRSPPGVVPPGFKEYPKMFTLRDLMSRNVQWAAPEVALNDVAKKMDLHNVSDLPVCEEGRLVGILSRNRIVTLGRMHDPHSSP